METHDLISYRAADAWISGDTPWGIRPGPAARIWV